ncbi:MAG TPA: polysaccharide deacetylase family protein, partial [Erysipelothrix sp.]|nr:polysaccharide deacetylase family protein [Erysipelothrix sp.]
MKKVLVLILSMALMACNPVPQSWTVTIIGLKDEPEIITVQQGENYRFVLPEDALFNRVFVNEVEVQLDANHEYLIEDIQTDIQITFNRQHTIILEQGVGYELVIVDDHQVVNEGQHVMFQLILDDDYDQSEPKVYINNIQTVLTDFEFEVEAVMSNLMITVRNVIRNPESPSIESPVAPPVETPVESPVESPIEPPKPNYGQYSNRDLSWWYRIPSPLNLGVQPTIEADIARLLQQYNGLWLKPATKKVIYLTMDEGYEYEQNTEQILDIAKVKQVPIMFFVTGSYVQRNPQLV